MRDRLLAVVEAGHRGDVDTATAALTDVEPRVRAAALSALQRVGRLEAATVHDALTDDDEVVVIAALQASLAFDIDITAFLSDPRDGVVEAAAYAAGEHEDPRALPALVAVAGEHTDELCRESAVAALGAIAAGTAPERDAGPVVDALLEAMSDRPAVRRRALLGLHQFDDPEAVRAVEAALGDKDRQVRGLAGELLGVAVD